MQMTLRDLHVLKEDGPRNIFMLDHDPHKAALYHCDKHLEKMAVEAAQMLSTAWHVLANDFWEPLDSFPPSGESSTPWLKWCVSNTKPPANPAGEPHGECWELCGGRIYTRSEVEHPCSVWVRELGGNYLWLWRLAAALCDEHKYRFGRWPSVTPVVWALELVPPSLADTVTTWSESPVVMYDYCKVEVGDYYDTVASYRNFFNTCKQTLFNWTKRKDPPWVERRPDNLAA